jgi:hypothetical protein
MELSARVADITTLDVDAILTREHSQIGGCESLVGQEAGQRLLRGRPLRRIGQINRGHARGIEEVPAEAGYRLGHCKLTGMGILRYYCELGTRWGRIGTGGLGGIMTCDDRERADEKRGNTRPEPEAPSPGRKWRSGHLHLHAESGNNEAGHTYRLRGGTPSLEKKTSKSVKWDGERQ